MRINDTRTNIDIQQLAEENNKNAKLNMKAYADKRRKAIKH
jgi:hypothetical protein